MKNYVLYILMRTDLPSMSPGRRMAQASHASNAFIKGHGKNSNAVREWQKQTNQGFGTAIVLAADIDQIFKVEDLAIDNYIPHDRVVDPDYVFQVNREVFNLIDKKRINYRIFSETDPNVVHISKKETTCFYVFGEKEVLNQKIPLLSELPLHP